MAKILVLAEKPSVGKDIARVLKCQKGGNGFLEGNQYIVTWALGHLVTLADPEKYSKKYKDWDIEDLPILPDKLELVVIPQTSKQYNVVKNLMLRNDVKELVIATDAGREGELVARWIIEKAHVRKPIKRLWISSVTDKAIRDGFASLKDGRQYNDLYQSAVSRSEADWLVGINATRALTCKHNAQLSCGRVQTPTISIIATREDEIRKFVARDFYGLKAKGSGINLTWQDNKTKDMKTFNQEYVEKLLNQLENKDGKVIDVQMNKKKTYAPLLYDLTELQRDANKMFGYSAKETLSIMQSLYEYHKVLTYPRTDSRYLTSDIISTIKDRLDASKGGNYDQIINKIDLSKVTPKSSFINNAKVSDHHAIIPTEQTAYLGAFDERESKIYDLVLKRFLSVLLPPFEYEQTLIKIEIEKETFVAKGKVVLKQGWKEVYGHFDDEEDDEIQEQLLPKCTKNQIIKIESLNITTGKTTPPPYFNEASLLSAMENPTKYIQNSNKDINKTLVETGGLGTVATRADIIEKLFSSFLLEKRGKDIHVTSKGRQLLSLVPEELKSPELTARWEMDLAKIAKGNLPSKKFMSEIRMYAKEVVADIKTSKESFKHDNISHKKCPTCGKALLEVNGKKGKMLVCSDRICGYRENVSMLTNARCPTCHKKLELVGPKEKQMFLCKNCGYREQMTAFKARIKSKGDQARKQDVQKYIKEQAKKQKEVAIEDNPFAALLAIKKDLK